MTTSQRVVAGSMESFSSHWCCGIGAGKDHPPASEVDGTTTGAFRDAADFIERHNNFQLNVETEIRVEMKGVKQEVTSRYAVAVARPDRLAMRLEAGTYGMTLVSDGKHLYQGLPMERRNMWSATRRIRSAQPVSTIELRWELVLASGASSSKPCGQQMSISS